LAREDIDAVRLAQEDADAVRLAQEDADAVDAVRLAQEDADAVRLAQEDDDAVDAVRLAQEDADAARALELERRRTIIRQSVNNSPSTLPLLNPSTNPINPLLSATVATPVGVVRQPDIINRVDLMTKGNAFLLKRNIQSKINSASAIL
jgi:regulator of protease activity HflC (stomatin/prohibitin superfamily)